jgi:hypothetical protein
MGTEESDYVQMWVAELAEMNVDVIFASSLTYVEPARQATKTIPIVFASHAHPIGVGHATPVAFNTTTWELPCCCSVRMMEITAVVLPTSAEVPVRELAIYQDFGAAHVFDFVDFGMPSTCPANRPEIQPLFESMLDTCLSMRADAVLVECGSDMLGANVPLALQCMLRRRPSAKVILAAGDPLGALGGKQVLKGMGISISLITGPCTDTSTALERTRSLCGVPVVARSGSLQALF